MPSLDKLRESEVRDYFSHNAWNKALAMQAQVFQPTRAGNTLQADVLGSELYAVAIEVTENGIAGDCSCPYEGPGLCKHIGAVLVRWMRARQTFNVVDASAKAPASVPPLAVRPATEPPSTHLRPAWLELPENAEAESDFADLCEALEPLTVVTLRELAAARGWTLRGTQKAGIVEQFARHLVDAQEIQTGLTMLSKGDRELLGLVAATGSFIAYHASERYAQILADYGKNITQRATNNALLRLGKVPLLLTSQLHKDPSIDFAYMPAALWPHFPPLLDALIPGTADLPAEAPTGDQRFSHPKRLVDAAVQMLLTVEHMAPQRTPPAPRPVLEDELPWLREWDYDPDELAKLVADGKLKRDTQLVVTVPPPPRSLIADHLALFTPLLGSEWSADFVFCLLQGAGLFLPGSPVRVDEAVKRAFLQRAPAAQHALLFAAYMNLLSWQEPWELMRAAAPHLQLMRSVRAVMYGTTEGPAEMRLQMLQLRHAILQILAWLPEDRWIASEDVVKLLYRIVPQFDQQWLVPNYYGYPQHTAWYFAWDRRRLKDSLEDWSRLQGAVLAAVLAGPLAWFGLVDLNFGPTQNITHVRLHGLADLYRQRAPAIDMDRSLHDADALGLPRPAQPLTPPTVTGATLRLHTLTGGATLLLEKIATPQTLALNNIVYQLNAGRAHEAFERGATVGALAAEWETCFGEALPETVRAQLAAWWDGYGSVRLYQNLTLLEFGDDYALQEIRAVTALDQVMLVELSPRAVLVQAGAVESLMTALQKAGYTPKLTDGTD